MSRLRPTLGNSTERAISDDTALYMICESVARRKSLIWGELRNKYGTCAIGAFFDDNPRAVLRCSLIDEVAAYNDSIPPLVNRQVRRNRVLGWLKWKLRVLAGMRPTTPLVTAEVVPIQTRIKNLKQKYLAPPAGAQESADEGRRSLGVASSSGRS